jgi:hypothetical protein
MIGSRQVKPLTPIGSEGPSATLAIFQQFDRPVFADMWLPLWWIFEEGNLTQCRGVCESGTFTAEIYIDDEVSPSFTVTESDNETPVELNVGKDGAINATTGSKIECKITAVSSGALGIYIYAD